MRKLNKGRKLSMKKGPREQLLKTMANSFFMHGKIKTTEPKAKELRSLTEKMITRAKKDNLANRRLLARQLPLSTVKKLFAEVAPKYKERQGGYTRIIRLGRRISDGATMVLFELV